MNIILKVRTKEHVITFYDKAQDEEIKNLIPFSYKSLDEALILYERSLKEDAESYGKVIYFDGRYVGDIWCYGIDENSEKMCMLSIVIFEKELWNKGIGTAAVKVFITEVFNKFHVDKIGAFVYSNNYRSIGLLRKAGFLKINSFVEDGIESVYFEVRKS